MKLTPAETLMVNIARGQNATGYHCMSTQGLGGKRMFYYWSWGAQPTRPLVADTPTKAAKLFLQHYEKGTEGTYTFNAPKPRLKTCRECGRPL